MEYTLLLVDDDDDDFILLTDFLKQGHLTITLTHAPNGVEATQLLAKGLQPNLILVDAQMPMMNGYELLVWLLNSEAWKYIPVVIWTGSISEPDIKRYYQAGAKAVLLKEDAMRDADAFYQYLLTLVLPSQPAMK